MVRTRVRELFDRQRQDAVGVLAVHYPLPSDVLSDARWERLALHRNPRLPWAALLEARTPPLELRLDLLSSNAGSFWSESRIARHEERWDWVKLSSNAHLPWSSQLIRRFASKWDWGQLSLNRHVPLTPSLIHSFQDRWVFSRLAANPAVQWDGTLVKTYDTRLGEPDPDWYPALADDAPTQLVPGIMLAQDGWAHLQQNPHVAWEEVFPRLRAPDWARLSRNSGFGWNARLIERHAGEVHFPSLSQNEAVEWTDALLVRWIDRLPSAPLSINPGLPWSDELVRRYADRWNWRNLSKNRGVPWSDALLAEYGDRVDYAELSLCGRLTLGLLERHADHLQWGGLGVSGNRELPWSAELIETYAARWSWEHLGFNPALPWSDELVARFSDRWFVRSFGRLDTHWEALREHLDDAWLRDWLRVGA